MAHRPKINRARKVTAIAVAACILVGASCSDSSSSGGKAAFVHQDVVLKDLLGAPLVAGSSQPYSPSETCGSCHWVEFIANGYHFQQGRTDEAGALIAKADYFDDGRDYINSAGMYGKW